MRFAKALSAILLMAATVLAQDPGYNYAKPEPPRGTYLPPPGSPPPTTQKPFRPEQQEQIDAEGINGATGEHEPGMPFDFTYAVKDDVGNDFSHAANSDGEVVKGEYRTLLPDGRLQIVKYTADWKNGYNAEVTYEGEATYPEPPKTPFRPDSETLIDSQAIRPSNPPPRPPPVQTTYRPAPQPTQPPRTQPPPTYRPAPPQTQPPRTQPPPTYRPVQTQAPQTQSPPVAPPGLYGAPSVPFGVRNNPKFGYSR